MVIAGITSDSPTNPNASLLFVSRYIHQPITVTVIRMPIIKVKRPITNDLNSGIPKGAQALLFKIGCSTLLGIENIQLR